jgi:hypothetical protein
MISWGRILYGAGLTVLLAAVVLVATRVTRDAAVLISALVATAVGPIGWNAILRATHASEFFTDAPIPVFPISWQDFGSGVFTLAAATLVLSVGPLREATAARALRVSAVPALVALLVDVYLY